MTDRTKAVLKKLLEDAYSGATDNASKARRAYGGKDMNFVVNEAGETRLDVLESYETREEELFYALKEVFPEWAPPPPPPVASR